MLEFNPETHEYRENGNVLPSVTQIIQAEGLSEFSFVKKSVLEYAWALGSAVHRATELHDLGELDESTVDDTVRPRFLQWEKFLIGAEERGWLNGERFAEKRLSSRLGFAGTPDRFFYYEKEKRLLGIDIKTGVKAVGTALQTSAYEILEIEHLKSQGKGVNKVTRIAVYLRDESYEIVEFKESTDKSNFLSLLNVYNLKKKWGIYKNGNLTNPD